MTHTLDADCNSFENNGINSAAAWFLSKMSPGSTNTIPPIKDGYIQLDLMIEDISTTSADKKAAMAGRPNGVTAKHLSKVWKTDVRTARRKIGSDKGFVYVVPLKSQSDFLFALSIC